MMYNDNDPYPAHSPEKMQKGYDAAAWLAENGIPAVPWVWCALMGLPYVPNIDSPQARLCARPNLRRKRAW